MNEIQSAINGKLVDLINERDQLKSELAASIAAQEEMRERLRNEIAEQKIPCCDVCGNPYTEENDDGNKCGTIGCPREQDGEWYRSVSYMKTGRELAVILVNRVRNVVCERDNLKSELTASIAAQEKANALMTEVRENPHNDCPFCDLGKLRKPNDPAKGHEPYCMYARIDAHLAASQTHVGEGVGK